MPAVFVSYSRKNKRFADIIVRKLNQRGITTWIDTQKIDYGDWRTRILEGIESSNIFIILLSKHAILSDEIRREVDIALSANKIIIPVRIENVLPTDWMKARINDVQFFDLFDQFDLKSDQLCDRIRRVLEAQAPGVLRPPPPPPGLRERMQIWLWEDRTRTTAIAGALLAAVATTVALWPAVSPPEPPDPMIAFREDARVALRGDGYGVDSIGAARAMVRGDSKALGHFHLLAIKPNAEGMRTALAEADPQSRRLPDLIQAALRAENDPVSSELVADMRATLEAVGGPTADLTGLRRASCGDAGRGPFPDWVVRLLRRNCDAEANWLNQTRRLLDQFGGRRPAAFNAENFSYAPERTTAMDMPELLRNRGNSSDLPVMGRAQLLAERQADQRVVLWDAVGRNSLVLPGSGRFAQLANCQGAVVPGRPICSVTADVLFPTQASPVLLQLTQIGPGPFPTVGEMMAANTPQRRQWRAIATSEGALFSGIPLNAVSLSEDGRALVAIGCVARRSPPNWFLAFGWNAPVERLLTETVEGISPFSNMGAGSLRIDFDGAVPSLSGQSQRSTDHLWTVFLTETDVATIARQPRMRLTVPGRPPITFASRNAVEAVVAVSRGGCR